MLLRSYVLALVEIGGLVILAACSDAQAPPDIVSLCTSLTQCGAISAVQTDVCIGDLAAATPDSATRAAHDCATCFSTMTCGDIAGGKCKAACAPFVQSAASTPGTYSVNASGMESCTVPSPTTTDNYARAGSDGSVELHWACDSTQGVDSLGAISVGDTRECASIAHYDTCIASGTYTMDEKMGRSWITGTCVCRSDVDQSVSTTTFDVPYRFVF